MMFIILALGLFGRIAAAPTQEYKETCPRIMGLAGISEDSFAPMVAHAIHSLSLEDIRYYFKADATEKNNIPIANLDWRSDKVRILEHAPLVGDDDEFSTPGLRHFDRVMRNMNRTWFGVKNYNTLEKVTHVLHMAEIWCKSGKQYRMVEKLLDPKSELCSCVNDIENNGVYQFLNLLAFKIRYPGITSGNETMIAQYVTARQKRSAYIIGGEYNFGGSYNIGGGYKFGFFKPEFRSALMDFDFDASDLQLLQEVAEKLVDGDGVMREHLDSADSWQYWKQAIKSMDMDDLYYNVAVFMFCRLNMD